MFVAYMIDNGMQSCLVKSYVSAIKKTLQIDGYIWDNNKVLISALTQACKLVNDRVKTRLPIQCGLLELILFELERVFNTQPYLATLYKTLFAIAYYGLLRPGEITLGPHVLKQRMCT